MDGEIREEIGSIKAQLDARAEDVRLLREDIRRLTEQVSVLQQTMASWQGRFTVLWLPLSAGVGAFVSEMLHILIQRV